MKHRRPPPHRSNRKQAAPAAARQAIGRRDLLLGSVAAVGGTIASHGCAPSSAAPPTTPASQPEAESPPSDSGAHSPGETSGSAAATRIDAHQHFWTYSPEEYGWIEPGSPLAAAFTPAQLSPQLQAAGVAGSVVVEARSHEHETERLLSLSQEHAFIRGVVGWLPLIDPAIEDTIAKHAVGSKLRGTRHALFAEADPEYALRPDFNRGIAALERAGLSYDLLVVPSNLPVAARLVDRHPNQRFILDHLAKPAIRSGALQPWLRDLRELALRPNVFAKLSGLITEADPENWKRSQLRPYLQAALELFTPHRLMFGSDWPVCTLAGGYAAWTDALAAELSALSPSEQQRIWSGTAIEAYRLG